MTPDPSNLAPGWLLWTHTDEEVNLTSLAEVAVEILARKFAVTRADFSDTPPQRWQLTMLLMEPLTVIVPTRNRSGMLRVALESVLVSPLIQSPQCIIVVDDDSTDDTARVVQAMGVQYLHVSEHHPSGSRNAGLRAAETPFVAFLDDDDAWLPGNMEPQLAALTARPEAAFAYARAQLASADLTPLSPSFPTPPLVDGHDPGRLHLGYPQLGVVLFRREAVIECGGFNRQIRYAEDAELMLRIAARHAIVGVDRIGMLHRSTRPPSKARADYFWSVRSHVRWTPRGRGVGGPSLLKFQMRTRGMFLYRFCEDAAACSARGDRAGALLCLTRAARIAPPHALRHLNAFAQALFRPRQFYFHSSAAPWP